MVTLQILVLPFLVRVRVAQQKKRRSTAFSFFVSMVQQLKDPAASSRIRQTPILKL